MFEVGDIIRHKNSGIYYLIADRYIYLSRNIERIDYIVIQMGACGGVYEKFHHPYMTTNYEKIT